MTDVIASVFADVHLSNGEGALVRDGNCFIIASTVNEYSPLQIFSRVVVDSSTSSPHNDL